MSSNFPVVILGKPENYPTNQLDIESRYGTIYDDEGKIYKEVDAELAIVNELQVLANVSHPHLIATFRMWIFPEGEKKLLSDAPEAEGYESIRLLIEMEKGLPLSRDLLSTFPMEKRREFVKQLVSALAFLQSCGNIIHGDIKIDNLVLVDDNLKVIDFGLINSSRTIIPEVSQSFCDLGSAIRQRSRGDHEIYDPSHSAMFALGMTIMLILYPDAPLECDRVRNRQLKMGIPKYLDDILLMGAEEWLMDQMKIPISDPYFRVMVRLLDDPEERYATFLQVGQDIKAVCSYGVSVPYHIKRRIIVTTEDMMYFYNKTCRSGRSLHLFETCVDLFNTYRQDYPDDVNFRQTVFDLATLLHHKRHNGTWSPTLLELVKRTKLNFCYISRIKHYWKNDATLMALYCLRSPEGWYLPDSNDVREICDRIGIKSSIDVDDRIDIWIHPFLQEIGLTLDKVILNFIDTDREDLVYDTTEGDVEDEDDEEELIDEAIMEDNESEDDSSPSSSSTSSSSSEVEFDDEDVEDDDPNSESFLDTFLEMSLSGAASSSSLTSR